MSRRDFEIEEGLRELLRASMRRNYFECLAAKAEALGNVERAAYARSMVSHWRRVGDRLIERGANIHVARALRAQGGVR